MTMHLENRLSMINTKKRKTKITKSHMAELHQQWLAHNKKYKQKNMHDMMYDTFDDYIDYCFGKTKTPKVSDRKSFKPYKANTTWRDNIDKQTYPSLPMSPIDNGSGRKKESMKYTGTLVKGIATMHKSNAVPVIDEQHAKDIARMRR